MTVKRSENGLKWPKKGPKRAQKGLNMGQNNIKTSPKWCQNDAKMIRKWPQSDPGSTRKWSKITPKWPYFGPNMVQLSLDDVAAAWKGVKRVVFFWILFSIFRFSGFFRFFFFFKFSRFFGFFDFLSIFSIFLNFFDLFLLRFSRGWGVVPRGCGWMVGGAPPGDPQPRDPHTPPPHGGPPLWVFKQANSKQEEIKSWWRRCGMKKVLKWSMGLKKRCKKRADVSEKVQKPGRHVHWCLRTFKYR